MNNLHANSGMKYWHSYQMQQKQCLLSTGESKELYICDMIFIQKYVNSVKIGGEGPQNWNILFRGC